MLWAGVLSAAEFHITPDGTPAGDGSESAPWDLPTAFAAPASVSPGDTLWLHAGRYPGSLRSDLEGAEGHPVVVRAVPGERVTMVVGEGPRPGGIVDFQLHGAHTRYQGFEVVCENPKRRTEISGSWPEDLQRGSVKVHGPRLELINLVIHDLGVGVGLWADSVGSTLYGCLIYNNGWTAPDRGHGHAIYTQNKDGTKTIAECVLFGQFGEGLHLYGSDKASLRGYRLEGIVSFANGRPHPTRNYLVGGGAPVDDMVMLECFSHGGTVQVGYAADADNGEVEVRGCYFAGQLRLQSPGAFTVEATTIVGEGALLEVGAPDALPEPALRVNGNRLFATANARNAVVLRAGGETRAGGVEVLEQYGEGSTLVDGAPAETAVFVRPNRFEPGRAHLIVYNWAGEESVEVDLGAVLETGERFRVVPADDVFGEAVAEGTYSGHSVEVPLRARTSAAPLGTAAAPAGPGGGSPPSFAVFVVVPQGGG